MKPFIFCVTYFILLLIKICQLTYVKISFVFSSNKVISQDFAPFSEKVENHRLKGCNLPMKNWKCKKVVFGIVEIMLEKLC